jgi:osmoprotectant transport system ATP-binding protein
MIELDKVVKSYGGRPAVAGISLTVPHGAFCALVGPSGSGKSTTLRLVNRLVALDSGTIRVDGADVAGVPEAALRRRIGYVIQSTGLFPHWTVERNIATVPRLLGWPAPRIRARVEELLDLLRLDREEYRGKYPHELSGGQQQRVGVARALAADPEVLLMDEPFGALDAATRAALQAELARLHAATGKTVLFVTHDMDEALRLADRIAILDRGRLVQTGSPREILERPASDLVRDLVGRGEIGVKRLALERVGDRVRPGESAGGEPVGLDMTLKEALSEMVVRGADRLPVRDAAGAPAGALLLVDLVR